MKFVMLPKVWEEPAEELEAAGHERVESVDDADFLFFSGGAGDLPELPKNIRFVQTTYAGMDGLAEAGLLTDAVRWANAGGLYADTVAESTLALMLGAGHLYKFATARASWSTQDEAQEKTDFLFHDKTVAIVGAGGIGRRLIELLEPFGVRVVAVNRSGRDVAGADEVTTFDELGEVWGRADYVVLLAPLTEETRGLVGKKELEAMKDSAFLVNAGRGGLVDTGALVEALRGGAIAGAALDVTAPEPLPDDHPLWGLENCLITPHVANTIPMMHALTGRLAVDNARAFEAGEKMPTEVDPKAGY